MKLRIAGSSIRLRILRPELVALQLGQTLQESVRLAPGSQGVLTYALSVASQTEAVRVAFDACDLQVRISTEQFRVWAREEEIGVYERIDFGNEGGLDLLLEKDFACLDQTEEENRDTFEHPRVGAAC